MRKVFVLSAAMALSLAMVGVASAEEHGQPWPEHGHIMLLHAEWTGSGPTTILHSYEKCVDIAGGNRNDHAHHTTIHRGRAGQALAGAGHLVIPTANFNPFTNCADFARMVLPPS